MSALNIVFAGTPEFGLPCLQALADSNHNLIAVYTQPDRPAGRGRKLQSSAVKSWALQHNIPVYQPVNFKNQENIDTLKSLKPDLLIVIAYGLILPASVLNIPTYGCINVHASLLPSWRGASPIQQSILHGDSKTGVTIMQMDVGLDTGGMILQASCPILSTDTSESLHNTLSQLAVEPLLKVVNAYPDHPIKAKKQSETLATYAGKINKEHAHIQWSQSVDMIDRKIRAYYPWPIAYACAQDVMIRVHKASIVQQEISMTAPGTIMHIDKEGIFVSAMDGILRIEALQFPGGKVITVSDWINAGRKLLYPGLTLQ